MDRTLITDNAKDEQLPRGEGEKLKNKDYT